MEVSGEHRIAAPRDRVWQALNDIHVLRASIPGCEELARISDTEYAVRVTAKIGAIKASFRGKVMLNDLDPPRSYVLSGEGQSGAAGFARGRAAVWLEESGIDTMVRWQAQAQVGGKLAQIGNRVLGGVAAAMARAFFDRFSVVVLGGETPPPSRPELPEAVPPPPAPEPLDAAPPMVGGAAPVEVAALAPTAAPVRSEPDIRPLRSRLPWPRSGDVAQWVGLVLWLGILFMVLGSRIF